MFKTYLKDQLNWGLKQKITDRTKPNAENTKSRHTFVCWHMKWGCSKTSICVLYQLLLLCLCSKDTPHLPLVSRSQSLPCYRYKAIAYSWSFIWKTVKETHTQTQQGRLGLYYCLSVDMHKKIGNMNYEVVIWGRLFGTGVRRTSFAAVEDVGVGLNWFLLEYSYLLQ